jgi:hypothetical protein
MASTGNIEVRQRGQVQKIHSVAGDQFDLEMDIVWGNNHIVINAIEDAKVEFLRLDSEVPTTDWEGKNLTVIAENIDIKAGEEEHFFFIYPISLSEDYMKINKGENLYYE